MSEDRSEDSKYVSWAKAVKVKYNFCCALCGASNVYLESHHLSSWDWDVAGRYNIENGVAICGGDNGCQAHKLFHRTFGYGGNHEYQFEQFKKIYKIFKNLTSSPAKIDASLNVNDK